MPVNGYGRHLLVALNLLHAYGVRHIYGGTVPEHVVAKRRRQDKAARAARKLHRRAK